MDGNGRWANRKGAERIFGHQNAVKAVRDVTEGCAELGIPYLTLYAFSTENWGRPKEEVMGLMQLLVSTIKSEVGTLNKNKVQLNAIGDLDLLPEACQEELMEAIDMTKSNKRLVLTLALSYSGRHEILNAARKLVREAREGKVHEDDLNVESFGNYLYTAGIPDPELLIRTSGEMRISNFLLWQVAYTEMYVTKTLWPDFRKKNLYMAIANYQKRERRFGKVSEQVKY